MKRKRIKLPKITGKTRIKYINLGGGRRKSFNKDFFIIVFIILCFFTTSFFWVWQRVELELSGIKSSGVIVQLEEEKDEIILSSDLFEKPLVAVMIDNYFEARPPINLSKAPFVWEAPVEAGITRFMAIFPLDENMDVDKIGPVRSLRPYFIDWAAELGAVIVHCGGSPEALRLIKTVYTKDLDQFFNDSAFWRTWARYAPHNLLTSTENLREAVKDKEYEKEDFDSWKFKEDLEILNRPREQKVTIDFWRPEHKIQWVYNKGKNNYERKQAGVFHKDEEGNKIIAKNIIIQFTDVKIIDSYGRREIRTIGEGRATVIMDGQRISAFWKKPSMEERTKFYNEHGEELSFNKGTTWVEVVPIDTKVIIE